MDDLVAELEQPREEAPDHWPRDPVHERTARHGVLDAILVQGLIGSNWFKHVRVTPDLERSPDLFVAELAIADVPVMARLPEQP